MKKLLLALLFLLPLGASAQQSFTASLIPTVDSRFHLGTTTGAFGLKAFLQVIADSFYDTDASNGCAEWASNVLTSTGSACGSGGSGGGNSKWATSTPITDIKPNAGQGVVIINATTTSATTTNFAISGVPSALLLTTSGGSVVPYAGATCTNQFVRVISALGATTCATVGAADVSLANLTATDTTLTFSGTYNGTTARTIGLNLGNANTWTGGQIFANSTTTNATTTSFAILNLTAASCDVKALTTGVIYCGTDATSAGGNPNSKWATSTADTLAIHTTDALRVGIGTTTPRWAFQVASSTGAQLTLSDPSTLTNNHWSFRNAGGLFYLATSSPSTFATSSDSALTIVPGGSAGLVGIASTSPFGVLSVENVGSSLSFVVNDQANDATPFVINAVGNVGIGTASPSQRLHVISPTATNANLNLETLNATAQVVFSSNTTWAAGTDSIDSYKFKISQSSTLSTNTRLTMAQNGGTGFGTSTPQWLLQLASSTRPQLTLSDGSLTSNHWSFRNYGGLFALATSSPSTFATSTVNAFSIDANGKPAFPFLVSCSSGIQSDANGALACGTSGTTAWNSIGDATGPGAIAMTESVQTLDWNTNDVTAPPNDFFSFNFVVDSATDIVTQRGVSINSPAGTTATFENLLRLNNAGTTIPDGLIVDGTAFTNALNLSDADIVNALSLGANDITATNWSVTGSSGLGTFGNLLSNGSSTLQNFTGVNSTTSQATTTSLFATTASTTNQTVTNLYLQNTIPSVAGQLGASSTQSALSYFGNGQLGTVPKVILVGVGTQTLTNSVSTDQDFTSVYTLPANALFTNKVYRVSLFLENVSGSAAITIIPYLKLGSTKVFTMPAVNITDNLTRSSVTQILIFGRAAAGAAAAVSTTMIGPISGPNQINDTNQPINLATNGTLAITPGVTYSGTGSTETVELQGWMIEELN